MYKLTFLDKFWITFMYHTLIQLNLTDPEFLNLGVNMLQKKKPLS